MSAEYLITTYGYYALFTGTCLEGETIMVLAGIAARQEMLSLPWVILFGFLGSLTGDQAIFIIARVWGKSILARWPSLVPRIEKVNRLLERHGTWYMISFRFFYGLRNPTPFVIGISSVPTAKFVLLNVLGAILWAITLGTGGYLFGAVVEGLLKDLKVVILSVAGLAAFVWLVRHIWMRRRKKHPAAAPPPAAIPPDEKPQD